MQNEFGKILINDMVFVKVANMVVDTVEGVAKVQTSLSDTFQRSIGIKALPSGINVEQGTEEVALDLRLALYSGFRIPDVAQSVQEKVKEIVGDFTGLRVVEVNIRVEDLIPA